MDDFRQVIDLDQVTGDDTVLVITRSQRMREAIGNRIKGLVKK